MLTSVWRGRLGRPEWKQGDLRKDNFIYVFAKE